MIMPDAMTYIAQTTLAVSLLIGLVLIVRRPFAKAFGAKAAYALWALPVLRLVMPPVPAGWTLFGLFEARDPQNVQSIAPTQETLLFAPELSSAPSLPIANIELGAPVAPVVDVQTTSLTSMLVDGLIASVPWIIALWLIGAACVFATSIIRQYRAARLIKAEARDAGPVLQTEAMNVCQSIGLDRSDIAVQTSLISSGPLVTGLVRPIVLLPEWFEEDYSKEEQRIALMHEMMHIKRRDLWALQIASIATALQWFNPLAWRALEAFRSDQEAACDADVLSVGEASPRSYGETLVKAVRISRPVAQPMHAASLPLTHSLHERLSQMKNPLPNTQQKRLASVLTASVGAAALLISACAVSATAQEDDLAGGSSYETESRVVVINEDESTRRMVLVDNPFDDVSFELTELEKLSEFKFNTGELDLKLEGLELGLEGLEGAKIAADVIALLDDADNGEFGREISAFADALRIEIEGGRFDEDRIEALAEDFEERMENWAESFEAKIEIHAEDWEAKMEANAEAWAEDFEERIEAWAEGFEAQAEQFELHFEGIEEHAEKIELAGETIEDLADECEDQNGIKVVTVRSNEDGTDRTYKAVCLDEGQSYSDAASILEEVRANGGLTEEELKRVEDALKDANRNGAKSKITIQRD